MRLACFAVIVLTVCACTTQVEVPSPANFVAANHPRSIWVHTKSATVRVDQPRVIHDSIIGVTDGRPFTMALSDVASITVRRIDWPATDGLLATGGFAMVVAVTLAHNNPASCYRLNPNWACGQQMPSASAVTDHGN